MSRTAEYLHILINNDLGTFEIEAIETTTEWGTTYYHYAMYFREDVEAELLKIANEKERIERIAEYRSDGIVAVLDLDCVISDENFDEAINKMFALKV